MSKAPNPSSPASSQRPLSDDARRLAARTLLQEAEAAYHKGEFGPTVMLAQRVLQLAPSSASAYLLQGLVAQRTGANEVATSLCRRVLALRPEHAGAHRHLGELAMTMQHWDEATSHYRRAIASAPEDSNGHAGLGGALLGAGQSTAAIESFRRALTLDPENRLAGYMLAGLTGERRPEQTGYVRAMFDGYAGYFEQHLTGTLHYDMPRSLAAGIEALHPLPFTAGLDLGCGTGLMGDALGRKHVPALDGVDLSTRMLAVAREKGRYRRLYEAELIESLARPEIAERRYDLVIAADVFIYVGALDDVFARLGRILAPGALFAFSLEHTEVPGFMLQASSRYAHSQSYVDELAAANGFAVELRRHMPLRDENRVALAGRADLLRRVAG